ncbi:tRNA dihydrouridine(20/20a) synthase DusA [Roseinatronobacter bogoriensis]|uniref:tRNA-dihydrouridine(20/20a) synthase n=1 Tax=Roseinatronobacter bogoriensis subsp. barguzinensis TaxID=441209 RepID=A0A2K8K8M8_9RHOB|nr:MULTISPECIES: tRNA dihydrouridine(20/20a) synthase DusA [Rhodobaca]ATX65799.1 tRNA dihydrouridine(20/20a) synthase DusA [Rhodobaca barguzinensis]MBB4208242.1 tRNA-dihydrouridine synthase A [Rhodobaca bogoriensis DSM 18756]TDW38883.1 tRNA-U16,U17-dihydrouridine synthase [Rhodobaca barguzinensis]TDY68934.1 tRNA-U16,U17-dihydrouridine synthase [Rhodobaca bogoriensis DSM 18756]
MPLHVTTNAALLSVAPMMDWTDRHCRYFHRQLSRHTQLYTEMVTAPALVRGGALHLLSHDPAENPLVLQLGGSDPQELAQATRIGWDAGYQEVNLNCGCPSDRVQSGCFGAVLMTQPELVGEICAAMIAASPACISVKCRIGVDDQDPTETLPRFLEVLVNAGITDVIIHARKAWLQGLSPKDNREIPPLDYPLVLAMKARFPHMRISLNGGVTSLSQARAFLDQGLDGVMIGRAAYQRPADLLLGADEEIYGQPAVATVHTALEAMRPYIARELSEGTKLASITRHMLGLFAGKPGARHWRRVLSENAHRRTAGLEVIDMALEAMAQAAPDNIERDIRA